MFLRQLKSIILKHIIGLFAKRANIEDHESEEFRQFYDTYGSILKLGAVEDGKNREKLAALVRFTTNQRDFVSLDDVSGRVLGGCGGGADDSGVR